MFTRFIVSVFLGLFSLLSVADAPLFAGAEYLEPSKTEAVQFWPLALGKARKVDGRFVFEKEQHINGEITQTTYRIRGERSLYDITRFYQSYAKSGDKKELYFCQGRSCGPSNYWANGYFHVRELYGPDANQRLWVFQTGKQQYQMLYLIERANRRIYLHVLEATAKPNE